MSSLPVWKPHFSDSLGEYQSDEIKKKVKPEVALAPQKRQPEEEEQEEQIRTLEDGLREYEKKIKIKQLENRSR